MGEAAQELDTLAQLLLQTAFGLAVQGPWREWSRRVPAGTVVEIDPAALAACGDASVTAVLKARERLVASAGELRAGSLRLSLPLRKMANCAVACRSAVRRRSPAA